MNGIFTSGTQLLHSIDWIVKSGCHIPEWKQVVGGVVVSEVKQITRVWYKIIYFFANSFNSLTLINALGIIVTMNNT